MKKVMAMVAGLMACAMVSAQQTDINYVGVHGATVGVEKNAVAEFDYGFQNDLHLNFKHTVDADEFKLQSYILGAGYGKDLGKYGAYEGKVSFSSDYTGNYTLCSARINAYSPLLLNVVKVGASVMPMYDSELKYKTGYAASLSFRCSEHISVLTEFSRVPEYRIAYKRFYGGFEFRVKNLDVKPMLYVPIYDSAFRIRNSKVVVSMSYTFCKK